MAEGIINQAEDMRQRAEGKGRHALEEAKKKYGKANEIVIKVEVL